MSVQYVDFLLAQKPDETPQHRKVKAGFLVQRDDGDAVCLQPSGQAPWLVLADNQ